jgi:hypothetical protein
MRSVFLCDCKSIIIINNIDTHSRLRPMAGRASPPSKPAISGGGGGRVQGWQVRLCGGCHWELSVGLCWGNYQMYRASLGLLAGVFGPGFREGAAYPTEEVW